MTTRKKTVARESSAKSDAARASSRVTRSTKRANGSKTPFPLREAIAEAAYYRAERRGFVPGYEVEDWLEAERELQAALQAKQTKRTAEPTRVRTATAEAALQA